LNGTNSQSDADQSKNPTDVQRAHRYRHMVKSLLLILLLVTINLITILPAEATTDYGYIYCDIGRQGGFLPYYRVGLNYSIAEFFKIQEGSVKMITKCRAH